MIDPYSIYTAIQIRIEYIQHDRRKHEPRLTHHDARLNEINMLYGIISTIAEEGEEQ